MKINIKLTQNYKMNKKKLYAGYLHLKPINGVIFPSYIQNQMNKAFIIDKLHGQFFMTTNENMYGDNSIILNSIIKEKSLSGIVMLSTFCLPESYIQREKFYRLCKKNKKSLHFILEDLNCKPKKFNKNKIEEFLIFDNKFFTNKKTDLTKDEEVYLNKSWQFI